MLVIITLLSLNHGRLSVFSCTQRRDSERSDLQNDATSNEQCATVTLPMHCFRNVQTLKAPREYI